MDSHFIKETRGRVWKYGNKLIDKNLSILELSSKRRSPHIIFNILNLQKDLWNEKSTQIS